MKSRFVTYKPRRTSELVYASCPYCNEVVSEHVPKCAVYTMSMKCSKGHVFVIYLHDVRGGVGMSGGCKFSVGDPKINKKDVLMVSFNVDSLVPGTAVRVYYGNKGANNMIVVECYSDIIQLTGIDGVTEVKIDKVIEGDVGIEILGR